LNKTHPKNFRGEFKKNVPILYDYSDKNGYKWIGIKPGLIKIDYFNLLTGLKNKNKKLTRLSVF
jgi:hypothetical protein